MIDALVCERQAEQGKKVVDLDRLNELEETIDDLKRAVQAMK